MDTLAERTEKKIETKKKIHKETVELKFKGNQKQFKINVELDSILDQIGTANVATDNKKISTLVTAGKTRIHIDKN